MARLHTIMTIALSTRLIRCHIGIHHGYRFIMVLHGVSDVFSCQIRQLLFSPFMTSWRVSQKQNSVLFYAKTNWRELIAINCNCYVDPLCFFSTCRYFHQSINNFIPHLHVKLPGRTQVKWVSRWCLCVAKLSAWSEVL